jgi:hypothetical protein
MIIWRCHPITTRHAASLLSIVKMEATISQLKKDFQEKVNLEHTSNHQPSTISVLTEEELHELENAWVQLELAKWKEAKSIR